MFSQAVLEVHVYMSLLCQVEVTSPVCFKLPSESKVVECLFVFFSDSEGLFTRYDN